MYFPADQLGEEFRVEPEYYDRQTGILKYSLKQAARVRIEAGTMGTDPETAMVVRRVLKTIVNSEPRTAGSVIESWRGEDESGDDPRSGSRAVRDLDQCDRAS